MDLAAALVWYTQLACAPGWDRYVWRRVNDLAAEHPEEFRNLPDLLTAALTGMATP